MIPRRLIRSVPEAVDPEQERLWEIAQAMHPDWTYVTYRDPIDPDPFPITSRLWDDCVSGAQLAGLVRLEALWNGGGVWLDSDFECYRSLQPLLGVPMFAGYEDPGVVPDAVLGSEPGHPAVKACLDLAVARFEGRSRDWRTDGPWGTGPGVTTTILPGRDDVLLLPPGSFYPYHYSVKAEVDLDRVRAENPWALGAHHWRASWT